MSEVDKEDGIGHGGGLEMDEGEEKAPLGDDGQPEVSEVR